MSYSELIDEMPDELYLSQVEKVVLNGAQTRDALAELSKSPGWNWFMRYAHNRAWRSIRRWVNTDVIKQEELQQRNLDMRQAKAIFAIPQLLKDAIAEVDAKIDKERNRE